MWFVLLYNEHFLLFIRYDVNFIKTWNSCITLPSNKRSKLLYTMVLVLKIYKVSISQLFSKLTHYIHQDLKVFTKFFLLENHFAFVYSHDGLISFTTSLIYVGRIFIHSDIDSCVCISTYHWPVVVTKVGDLRAFPFVCFNTTYLDTNRSL